MPLGHSASGVLIESWVEVTAAFASQSTGPSPATISVANRKKCTEAHPGTHPGLATVVRATGCRDRS